MVELVLRDCDYRPYGFEEFYESELADSMRQSKHYKVSIDFIRNMLRRHDNEMAMGEEDKQRQKENGPNAASSSGAAVTGETGGGGPRGRSASSAGTEFADP